jgi:amidase
MIAVGMLAATCSRESPAPAPAAAPTPRSTSIDVVELSAVTARDRMSAGALTARELTEAYLERIKAIDDAGPALNAIIELNPNALADAQTLDAERKSGKLRGPLHGLPVLIKDNVDIAGMVNSAGSLALAENRPAQDAFIVARLRQQGAVILGKTNLSEWANFRSTRSTSGWSSRGGQTKNPYVLDRNPCGSSSGTGAAIAASLAAIGVGTETDGSIICPAAVTALVGLKPTVGLVSRRGIIPISASQDTAGPMGRTVADVALMLNGLAGADEQDSDGRAANGHIPDNYLAFLDADAVKGKRFGVLRQAMGYHPDSDAVVAKASQVLRVLGATVMDVKIDTRERWNGGELGCCYEFKDGLNRYRPRAVRRTNRSRR